MQSSRRITRTAGPLLGARQGCCASLCVIAFTVFASATVTRAADENGGDASASSSSTVNDELRAYRAMRRMHAWTEKFSHEAWMDVWTELKDGKFQYEIVSERGSEMIRSKVLRTVLTREQEMINQGNSDKADLTPENYDFAEAGRDPDGSRYVQIKPRRKDVMLVDGRMVFSPDGRDVVRVEGRLAKNPSFWTSLVNIVRRYARLGGVRVPVSTESTAKVKFAGTSQLEVSYEYESINGRAMNVSAQRR